MIRFNRDEDIPRPKSSNTNYMSKTQLITRNEAVTMPRAKTSHERRPSGRYNLETPDRWILERVTKEQVIYVDVRHTTFPIKIKCGRSAASRRQTVKWLTDVVCDHFIHEFDFITEREKFTAIDIVDRTGVRLMPDSLLCDLLEWIPNLHPVVTVMQMSDFNVSRHHHFWMSIWCSFRYLMAAKCINRTTTDEATISLSYTESMLREVAVNKLVGEEHLAGAALLVTSEDWTEPKWFTRKVTDWKIEFEASTDRRLKFQIELHKKEDVVKSKPKPKRKLKEAVQKMNFIRRMFTVRSTDKLMEAFEAEWNRPELQDFLESAELTQEEICEMKEIVKKHYSHTSIAFKAVCANVGESRWLSSAGFRALITKSSICKTKRISQVWTTLNQNDSGTSQSKNRGVVKADCNNMDRGEFLEALVRFSVSEKKEGVSVAQSYEDMYKLFKKNAIGEEVVEIERYLSDSQVNMAFSEYEKDVIRCYKKFAGIEGEDGTIDISEFMLFFEELLGEKVPKSCHLSRREMLGIFFQSQVFDESTDIAGDDEYELDRTEFYEAIVRTVHVVMKKISELNEKDKARYINFEVPETFPGQLRLILGWIAELSKKRIK